MMYPFITLNNNTEIVHSEMLIDGRVKVYIETPDSKDGFHNAVCYLPNYEWEDISGYSATEMDFFNQLIHANAHLIIEFSQKENINIYEQENDIYTIDDIYALPENERAELIDGKMLYLPMPNVEHQFILGELLMLIGNYIKENNKKCKVVLAPFAVYLNGDESEYFEPDISVICDLEKLNNEKGCIGAPDMIIEITSSTTTKRDYTLKPYKYLSAGVHEYWIVNPERQIIFAYYMDETRFEINNYTFQDQVKVIIFENLFIDFKNIVF